MGEVVYDRRGRRRPGQWVRSVGPQPYDKVGGTLRCLQCGCRHMQPHVKGCPWLVRMQRLTQAELEGY